MRSDTVYKRAFNQTVDLLASMEAGEILPSENGLRRQLDISRTTVRKVLREMAGRGLVTDSGAGWRPARRPTDSDRFPVAETTSRISHVEQQFMEWMLRRDTRPGTLINELDLARQFGVATSGVREFLIRFSRFGLIEKKPNSGWLFSGFTEGFALELFEIRMLFELRSARTFAEQPESSLLWPQLRALKAEHEALLAEVDHRFHDFSSLDNRFHLLINKAAPNRFIDDFYGIITLIFHYHYQWSKVNEMDRNRVAITEHLRYIDALFSRDQAQIDTACRAHLASARNTLMLSLIQPVQTSETEKLKKR